MAADAVEMPADLGNERKTLWPRGKAGVERTQSGSEELYGAVVIDDRRAIAALRRHIERRHAIDILALDAQDFLAGRQNQHIGTHADDRLGKSCRGVGEVLAVVEHKQDLFSADCPGDGFGGNLLAADPQAEHGCDRGRHEYGSDNAASSTNQQSPSSAGKSARATSSANTLFPIPPGPVSVTTR